MGYTAEAIKEILNTKVKRTKYMYQKTILRKDKWGLIMTVYFWKLARPVSFDRYDIEDEESWATILHMIKTSSNKARMEFKRMYGKDFKKHIKRGQNI